MKIQIKKSCLKQFNIKSSHFIKFPKYNITYNYRMGITETMLKNDAKTFKDIMDLNDFTDFKLLALGLQSQMFYDQLFSNLSTYNIFNKI